MKELSETIENVQTEAEKMMAQYNGAAEKIGEAAQIISQAEDGLQAEAERAGHQLDAAGTELSRQVDSANSQISEANEALSSAASSTNSQIDQAIVAAFQTDPISVEEETVEEAEEEPESFWDKVKGLFE